MNKETKILIGGAVKNALILGGVYCISMFATRGVIAQCQDKVDELELHKDIEKNEKRSAELAEKYKKI